MASRELARRHPEGGGYSRGEETRTRIIATALRVFGELGFDQASTRLIATEARVNPPALQYYFDSKAGLHLACVQHIIDATLKWLDPLLAGTRGIIASGDTVRATEAVCEISDALINAILDAGTETWSRFLARTKAEGDEPGMDLLREQIGKRLIDSLSGLIALVAARRAGDDEVRLQAAMIVGQVGWFSSNRTGVLELMNWLHFDEDKIKLMKQLTRRQIRATLRTMAGADAAQARKTRRRAS